MAAAGKNPVITTAFSSGVAPFRTVRPRLSCPQRVCNVAPTATIVRTRTASTLTTSITSTTVLNASPAGHNEEIFAEINQSLMENVGFELRYVSVDVTESYFEPLWTQSSTSKTISLERFDPLRLEDEDDKFFPKVRNLLVRSGMKRIFRRFQNDVMKPAGDRRALLGSPGTGKSLLFFLAAVWKAAYGGQKVVYLRKTTAEPISIFYMFPDGEDKVGFYFKRFKRSEVSKNKKKLQYLDLVLGPILLAVEPHLVELGDALLFVDGPAHDDKDNALADFFDYFCSSAGYPQPKTEAYPYFLFWILEGWSRDEVIDALTTIHNTTKDVAIEIYKICGGKIREGVRAIRDGDLSSIPK
jgi:hypothetical protein